MLSIFKKKYKSIDEYPKTWSVAQSKIDGKPIFLRFRDGLKEAIGHTDYSYKIGIAIPFNSPTIYGLISDDEAQEIGKIEDSLELILENQEKGIFAMAITFNGMREYIFYMREWKPEIYEKMIKSIYSESHEIQFMMETDPDWITFKNFTK